MNKEYKTFYFRVETWRSIAKYLSVAKDEKAALENLAKYVLHDSDLDNFFKAKIENGMRFSYGKGGWVDIYKWIGRYGETEKDYGKVNKYESRERVCEMTIC